MTVDLHQETRSRACVRAGDVATLERCRTCRHSDSCVRHAPKTCLRNDKQAHQRMANRNSYRIYFLSHEEIEILSILEIGFAVTAVPRKGRKMENSQ